MKFFLKKVMLVAVAALMVYEIFAFYALYHSSVFNVIAYYTHPPLKFGDIRVSRLPMIAGERAALFILRELKSDEIASLLDNGEVGLAATLTSYEGEVPDEEFLRPRVMIIAEVLINNGYDLRKCEYQGKSSAQLLESWGKLDQTNRNFLLKFMSKEDMSSCYTR